jgi:hypothetical protein
MISADRVPILIRRAHANSGDRLEVRKQGRLTIVSANPRYIRITANYWQLSEPELVPQISIVKARVAADEYMALSKEQKENLIDQLENKLHTLKEQSRRDPRVLPELEQVRTLLGRVKVCDVVDRVKYNQLDSEALRAEFRKRHQLLRTEDFNHIISLTAPKKDRKPDEHLALWTKGKALTKHLKYLPLPKDADQKLYKIKTLPPLPKELKQELSEKQKGNFGALGLHLYHPDQLKPKQYDLKTFSGLMTY